MNHAINFIGQNWFVVVDAYSKYSCIHPTSLLFSKATIDLLQEDFGTLDIPLLLCRIMPLVSSPTNFRSTATNGKLFISLVLPTILQQTERQSDLFRSSSKP